jgi:predicted kinase
MRTWAEMSGAGDEAIIEWAGAQPRAARMRECGQDAGWHAEGDVWTHTLMVCRALYSLEDWAVLHREDQVRLLLTAIFHDSGKPETTAVDPETGRTRSPRHSLAGERIARTALRSLGCPLEMRESICALARWHGRPPYLLEKKSPEEEIIRLSWLVDHRLLYLFALADTRGRLAAETSRTEDTLHLWKQTAEELGCYGRPYPFVNDHARFLFYRDELSSLHYTPQEDFSCTATLVCGLPGSGKDTWLARHRSNLPVVSLDDVRGDMDVSAEDNQGSVIQEARERCRVHLRAGEDFAFNATSISRQLRKRWVDLFRDYRARIEIIWLEPPLTQILRQNRERSSRVPERVILNLLDCTEIPDWTEAHLLTRAEEV